MRNLLLLLITVLYYGYLSAQCSFQSVGTLQFSACAPDETFSISGVVSFANPPATGDLILRDCNGYQTVVASAPFGTSITFSGDGYQANGAACNLTFEFTTGGCTSPTFNIQFPSCNCAFTYSNLNRSACDPITDTYTLSGDLSFSFPPTTGQLIIQNCYGETVVLNAPFTSPAAYSFPNMPSNGANCSVNAYFTEESTCTFTHSGWTNPESCLWDCESDAGTYLTLADGLTNSEHPGPYDLCYEDVIYILSNGDFTYPTPQTGIVDENNNPVVYDPGLWLLLYECEPTIFPPGTFLDDPCFLGVISSDNEPWGITNTIGDNGTRWLVPLTMYSQESGIYDIITNINGEDYHCFDLGQPVEVTFLRNITGTVAQDCQLGTASVTLQGGKPSQTPGATFNVVPGSVTPATATVVQGSITNGGTITIGGLLPGQAFSYVVTDGVGCGVMITGTYVGPNNATIAYPNPAYCLGSGNATPTITGSTGGVFTSTAGLVINGATGVVNTNTSTPGTYTVTYTPPGGYCANSTTTTITIHPRPTLVTANASICSGENTTINVSGAASYTWTPTASLDQSTGASVIASPTTNTTYTITGTDANGCTNTTTAVITVNPLPTLGGTLTSCIGQTRQLTFSATANATNPFISSNPGVATVSATGLVTAVSAGTTEITYTNSNNCSRTVTFTVNPNPTITVTSPTVCMTGTTTITATGGVNYAWTPGTSLNTTNAATVTFTPGETTTYTVTGTDANGCSNTAVSTVTVLPNAPIDAGPDQTICAGSSATVVASGGATYTWNAGLGAGQSHTVSPTTTTTYTVTGTDANGCVGTDQVVVNVSNPPTAGIAGNASVCLGATNPNVTFTAVGANAPFTFTYTLNGGTPQNIISTGNTATISIPTTAEGTFTYALTQVTDALGCSQAQTGSATVTVNGLPTATITGTTQVCQGQTAPTLTLTGNGGTAPYTVTYTINNGAPITVNTNLAGVATVSVPTATIGTFTYQITQIASAAGCSQAQTAQTVVTVNPLPTVTATVPANVCQDATQPFITFTAAGGTAPYVISYNINGGATQTVTTAGTSATVAVPTNTAGIFNYNIVSVIDNNGTGCVGTTTSTATITVNAAPTINGNLSACAGSTSQLIGTAPAAATNAWTSSNPAVATVSSTGLVTALAVGSTTITYTNLAGCLTTTTFNVVTSPTIVGANASVCPGTPINLTVSGAQTYTWSPALNLNTTAGATVTFTGVADQTYTVTGTDAGGCTGTTTVNVSVLPLPTIVASADQVICPGGSATIFATGGLNYTWSNGLGAGQTHTVNPNAATTYTVTGTGANGCTNTDQVSITLSTPPTGNIAGGTTVCQGATAPQVTFTGVNGTAPYTFTYSINGGAIMTVVSNGAGVATLNVSTFATGSSTYTLTSVVDVNGCSQTLNTSTTFNVLPLPTATITGNASVCQNGAQPEVILNGSNGTAPYVFTYTINGGTPQNAISDGNGVATINVPTTTAGSFTYAITNVADASANACSQVQVGQVTVVVTPLPTATVSGSVNVCQDATTPAITFTGANGTAPYTFTYSINGGANETIISAGNSATILVPTNTTGIFNYNLVSVSDNGGNGCSQPQAGTATVVVNPNPVPTINGQTEYCMGNTANVGTTQTFNTYSWSNGQSTANAQVTAANNPITVTVTNAFGCQTTSAPYFVTENTVIVHNETISICQGQSTVIHGVTRTVAGTYSVTLPSNQGCDSTSNVTLVVNAIPAVNAGNDVTVCQGSTVTLTGTGAQTYVWNNGITNGVPFQPAGSQVYTVTGTDLNGCSNSDQVIVSVNPLPVINSVANQTLCATSNTTAIAFSSNVGGTTYTWVNSNPAIGLAANGNGNIPSFVATNSTTATLTGTVTVTPTANGCTGAPITFTITVLPTPTATITGTTSVCLNGSAPTITFTGANGVAPFTFRYTLNGGAQQTVVSSGSTATLTVPTNTPGTFTYTLVGVSEASGNACQATLNSSAVVTVVDLPTATITGPTSVCQDAGMVILTLTGAGGTAPYTFTYSINGDATQTVNSTGATAGITIPSSTVGTVSVNLISVQEASGLSCSRTVNEVALVVVNPLPTPTITGNLTYCEGQTTTLSTQAYNGYLWSNGQTSQNVQVTEANNPITVQVTDANGCQATSPAVNVNAIELLSSNTTITICQGQSAVIHGITQNTAGTYVQTYTSVLGCDSVATVNLVVNPLPTLTVNGDLTICEGQSTILSGNGAVTYTWDNGVTNGVPFTPAVGTTTYTMTGTDANGCVNTTTYTQVVNALPVMTAMTPMDACIGATVTPSAFNSNPAGTYTWTNTETAIGLAANGNGNITPFVAANPSNAPLSATITVTPTANGCVGTPENFTISVQPAITLQAEVTVAEVCIDGAAPEIQLNLANGVAPYTITYAINGGPVQTVTGGANQTISVPTTVAGVFTYNFTSVQSGGGLQCTTPIAITSIVEVHDRPVVNAGVDVQVCPDATVILNATGTANQYTWSNGVNNGDELVVTQSSLLTVTGVDANGCSNTDDIQITMMTPIAVNAGPDLAVCIGETATLSATMADDSQGQYTWTQGVVDGHEFTPTTSLLYTVTAIDENGCTTTDDVVVTVHNLPTISAGPNIAACIGNDVTLTGSGANGGTYTWDNGVINGVSFVPSVGTTTYTVTGTDQNGCSNQSTVQVFVQDAPTVTFTAVQNGVCAPVQVVLTNTSPIMGQNCVWYVDGLEPIYGCGTQTITVNQPGSYSVTLDMETNENGCAGSSTQVNVIQVDQMPNANFTYSPNEVTEINNVVEFENLSSNSVSYSWNFGNGTTSTQSNPIVNFGTEITTYNVMLTAMSQLGCVDTMIQVIRVKEELIFFIPNTFTPDGGLFNEIFTPVFVSGYDPYDFVMYIYNRWGEMVFETHNASVGWNGKYGVDGPNVPDGTYTWKIEVKTHSDQSGERSTFTGHVNVLR